MDKEWLRARPTSLGQRTLPRRRINEHAHCSVPTVIDGLAFWHGLVGGRSNRMSYFQRSMVTEVSSGWPSRPFTHCKSSTLPRHFPGSAIRAKRRLLQARPPRPKLPRHVTNGLANGSKRRCGSTIANSCKFFQMTLARGHPLFRGAGDRTHAAAPTSAARTGQPTGGRTRGKPCVSGRLRRLPSRYYADACQIAPETKRHPSEEAEE